MTKGSRFDIGKDGGNFSTHHHWDYVPALRKYLKNSDAAIVLVYIMYEWDYKNKLQEPGFEVPFECSIRKLATKSGYHPTQIARAIEKLSGKESKKESLLTIEGSRNGKTNFTPNVGKIKEVLKDFIESKEKKTTKKEREKKIPPPEADCREEKQGEVNYYPDNPFEKYLKNETSQKIRKRR